LSADKNVDSVIITEILIAVIPEKRSTYWFPNAMPHNFFNGPSNRSYTMNRAPPRIKSVEIHPCKSGSEINLKQSTLASLVTEKNWG
jgi:hypothetical protein